MNSNDASTEISNNYGILSKIIRFLKKIFGKDNIKYISEANNENKNNKNDNPFFKSIKFKEDPDKAMLLKIQDDFDKMDINKENAFKLTKDLSDIQKQKLEDLYKKQIEEYEISINNYKNKIIAMKNKMVKANN